MALSGPNIVTTSRREIGSEAVWTLSSAKPGNGVLQLRDNNIDTFWQSDGSQPHLVNIEFHKKMKILDIALYADFKLDESYTPNKLSIRVGTSFDDLKEIRQVDLDEPQGWVPIAVSPIATQTGDESYLRSNVIQIAILSSHQNGRDTHIRQIKIYGPTLSIKKTFSCDLSRFTSEEFSQFACIR
eukprot:63033_1